LSPTEEEQKIWRRPKSISSAFSLLSQIIAQIPHQIGPHYFIIILWRSHLNKSFFETYKLNFINQEYILIALANSQNGQHCLWGQTCLLRNSRLL
jgi:hypothetical protein